MRNRLIILLLGVVLGLGAKGVKLAYDAAAATSVGESEKAVEANLSSKPSASRK